MSDPSLGVTSQRKLGKLANKGRGQTDYHDGKISARKRKDYGKELEENQRSLEKVRTDFHTESTPLEVNENPHRRKRRHVKRRKYLGHDPMR